MPSPVIPPVDNFLASHLMEKFDCTVLQQWCTASADSRLKILQQQLDGLDEVSKVIALYHRAVPLIEQQLWALAFSEENFRRYQQLFQELEQHYALLEYDKRHSFVVVVPVADRPQHLQTCLQSLLQLCRSYHYGGQRHGCYQKVSVLIADDSKDSANMAQHQAMAAQFSAQGLHTEYFGLDEQLQFIELLDERERQQFITVLGDIDRTSFYHKGASIMRNITYLKLNRQYRSNDKQLIYFIDSDQEFKLQLSNGNTHADVCAINFFYHLEQIFSNADVTMLTGKVVGDPPVSPAVMASNFLDDVIAFISQISQMVATESCQFHGVQKPQRDNATYHDMADMFGFKPTVESLQYRCGLAGEHDHVACLHDFAIRLNHFFDGEHPTRKIDFEYCGVENSIAPARTVYTGNYVFKPAMLDYFIPFAMLKLRMAGPVLGRLVKAAIGAQFISANIPMLHKRTVDELGQSEFRPGIERDRVRVDLSNEFERQFFGDVMLFTIEQLTTLGYPFQEISKKVVTSILLEVEATLLQQYTAKHEQIINKLTVLKNILDNKTQWWHDDEHALVYFNQFINNMAWNFGDESIAYTAIQSDENRALHRTRILEAIMNYRTVLVNWQTVLKKYE